MRIHIARVSVTRGFIRSTSCELSDQDDCIGPTLAFLIDNCDQIHSACTRCCRHCRTEDQRVYVLPNSPEADRLLTAWEVDHLKRFHPEVQEEILAQKQES